MLQIKRAASPLINLFIIYILFSTIQSYANQLNPLLYSLESPQILFHPYEDVRLSHQQKLAINEIYKRTISNQSYQNVKKQNQALNKKLIEITEADDLNETELNNILTKISKLKSLELLTQVHIQNEIWKILTTEQRQHVLETRNKLNLLQK